MYRDVMSRPIEYSRDEARAAIARVFAAHGYDATSLAMLMQASGLGKQSLYNAFGDKQQMYLDAVDHSVAQFGGVATAMNAAENGMAAIEACFAHLLECCLSGAPDVSNCIVSNGLLSNAHDPVLHERHRTRWAASHAMLKASIERGQRDGSLSRAFSATAGADVLMSHMSGLRVCARAYLTESNNRSARTRLQHSVEVSLALFRTTPSS
jgi:TetR/AcrR family transcriptional regulator, transcriptional repressor for nem operon